MIDAGFSRLNFASSNGSPNSAAMLSGGRILFRSGTSSQVRPGHAPGSIAAIAPKVSGYLNPSRRLPKPPIEIPVTIVVSRVALTRYFARRWGKSSVMMNVSQRFLPS